MENVQLVGHMILSASEKCPLSEALIDETEMVSFDYLVIALSHFVLGSIALSGPP
jgi:hypothetical protein